MAIGDRTPRLGHLRPVQHRERQTEPGHRAGRPEGSHGTCRTHRRPAFRRHRLVSLGIRGTGVRTGKGSHAGIRRRYEPRPRMAQRTGSGLLALWLQLVPLRRDALSEGRRHQHPGRPSGESTRIIPLVSRRRAVPQRTPGHQRRRLRPDLGHTTDHPRGKPGLCQGQSEDQPCLPQRKEN